MTSILDDDLPAADVSLGQSPVSRASTENTLEHSTVAFVEAVKFALRDGGEANPQVTVETQLDRGLLDSLDIVNIKASFESSTGTRLQSGCEVQLQRLLLNGATVAECASLLFENPLKDRPKPR